MVCWWVGVVVVVVVVVVVSGGVRHAVVLGAGWATYRRRVV